MSNTHFVDGALVQWGDRLFYPGNRIVRSRGAVLSGAMLHDHAAPFASACMPPSFAVHRR